jgi:GDP-D-mannose dehydratase
MTDDLARALSATVGHFGQISFAPSTPRKQMDGSRLNSSGWQAQPPLSTVLQLTHADFLIDPSHCRPTEVETLLGAPTKARERLVWLPVISTKDMCKEMVAADLAEAKKKSLLQQHGFKAAVSFEQ